MHANDSLKVRYTALKFGNCSSHFTDDLHCLENSNLIESGDLLHIIVRKPTSDQLSKLICVVEDIFQPSLI